MRHTNLDEFAHDLRDHFGLVDGERVVVGVSAGVDSVVLVRMIREAGMTPIVAHVNYGLRGRESDEDETLVRELAEELGIQIRVEQCQLPEDGNLQELARDARYEFFGRVAEEERAEFVAVAHHQDDQAETVLLNLFRGAGPNGLAGMRPSRPLAPDSSMKLIRPLLGWSRGEIEDLARERNWGWREDESNATLAYRRNWIRTKLMPRIQGEFGEGAVSRIADSARRVRAMAELIGSSARLSVADLKSLPEPQRHTIYAASLQRFDPSSARGSEALVEVDALLDAQPGKRVEWPGITIWRERDALFFESTGTDDAAPSWSIKGQGISETPFGKLSVTRQPDIPKNLRSGGKYVEYVDSEALQSPLLIRPWTAGDRFTPLGLGGTKLVSDLLTDAKTRPSKRAAQLVLCSGNKIIWAVGYRLAEEARIWPTTRNVARLEWTPVEGA